MDDCGASVVVISGEKHSLCWVRLTPLIRFRRFVW